MNNYCLLSLPVMWYTIVDHCTETKKSVSFSTFELIVLQLLLLLYTSIDDYEIIRFRLLYGEAEKEEEE